MKVSLKRLCVYCVFLFYLLENHFYYLINVNNTILKYILFSMCLFIYIYVLARLLSKNQKLVQKKQVLLYCYILIPVFLSCQFIYTKEVYSQGVVNFLKASYHYAFVILTIPIYYIFSKEQGITKFMNKLIDIVSVGLFLNIINSVMYNTTGRMILKITIRLRNESLRSNYISSILGVVIVYTAWKIFHLKKYKKKDLINFIIQIIALVYCNQSRIIEVTVVLVIAMLILYKKKLTKKQLLVISVVAVVAIGGFTLGTVGDFFESFKIGGHYSGSTSSRIREYYYYIDGFMSNKIFGLGLLATESEVGNAVIRGPFGNNYPTDVGYIGALGNMGLSVIIPLCFFLYRVSCVVRKANRVENRSNEVIDLSVLCSCLLFYIVISGITQIITDPVRILCLPFVLAIVEWTDTLLAKGIAEKSL